jgi:hypothetical protein
VVKKMAVLAAALSLLPACATICKIAPSACPSPSPTPPACVAKPAPWCADTGGKAPCWETTSADANLCSYVCEDDQRSEPVDCFKVPAACRPGRTCGCYAQPPGQGWQYVCCDPYALVPDPSQCPAKPCILPDFTGWVPMSPMPKPIMTAVVGQAVNVVKRDHPELFVEGGARLAKGPSGADEFFALVALAIQRDSHVCAGQEPHADSISVRITHQQYEAWQLIEYGAGRLRPVTLPTPENPNPEEPACKGGCSWVPPPPPPPVACGKPDPPPPYKIGVKIAPGFNKNLDATGLVYGFDYCTSVGFVNRTFCPVRGEGAPDRAACELKVFGIPQWKVSGAEGCKITPCGVAPYCDTPDFKNHNPWQAVVEGHGCTVRVCDATTGAACGTVAIP